MTITFTIPYALLHAILAELRRHPHHVAVGNLGLNVLPTGAIELLARSFRLVHEGALRRQQETHTPGFQLGFVPYALNRPQVWQAVAFATRIEGDLPVQPTCSILLGSGKDVGLFTGIASVQDHIRSVQTMRIVGPGMHRLAAMDFSYPQKVTRTPPFLCLARSL